MNFFQSFTNKLKSILGIGKIGGVGKIGGIGPIKDASAPVPKESQKSSKAYDQFSLGVKKREEGVSQPVKDGKKATPGTSESNQELPQKNIESLAAIGYLDKRNKNITYAPDGSAIDNDPQSWENTTRQPHRNGNPTSSDLVSRISHNAVSKTTEIDTKRGGHYEVPDDGTEFESIEQAGSKGRYTVANHGY